MCTTSSIFTAQELSRCDSFPVCCRLIDGRDAALEEYMAAYTVRRDIASVMAWGDLRAGRVETIIECRRTSSPTQPGQTSTGEEGRLAALASRDIAQPSQPPVVPGFHRTGGA